MAAGAGEFDTTITIRIPRPVDSKLRQRAEQAGGGVTQFARWLLIDALDELERREKSRPQPDAWPRAGRKPKAARQDQAVLMT